MATLMGVGPFFRCGDELLHCALLGVDYVEPNRRA